METLMDIYRARIASGDLRADPAQEAALPELERIRATLAEPVKVLNELLQSGHRVYVHCNAGVCRAPATVLGYLCHYRGMTIDEGLNYIREQRPQANPYISAVQQALNQLKSGDSM